MDTAHQSLTATRLFSNFGNAAAPLIIDVRAAEAFHANTTMIAGATWRDPATVLAWRKYVPRHRSVVVYCVHGLEISKNACAALREVGIDAAMLEGGIHGWQAAQYPTVEKSSDLSIPSAINTPSRWITRERPKIDRIACPWLIRRFIDPMAEFIFVPADQVISRASETGAIAFDVPKVQFTHRDDACSFDAFIGDFALTDPLLQPLALIVRGADTDQLALSSQSAGLLAISLGLSHLYTDDHQMLAHGMVIYDALYAWLKHNSERVAQHKQAETHNADLFKS